MQKLRSFIDQNTCDGLSRLNIGRTASQIDKKEDQRPSERLDSHL